MFDCQQNYQKTTVQMKIKSRILFSLLCITITQIHILKFDTFCQNLVRPWLYWTYHDICLDLHTFHSCSKVRKNYLLQRDFHFMHFTGRWRNFPHENSSGIICYPSESFNYRISRGRAYLYVSIFSETSRTGFKFRSKFQNRHLKSLSFSRIGQI